MRIVIEIDGDQVMIHRIDEATAPVDVLTRAAAIGAVSAGAGPAALSPGSVVRFDAATGEVADAGRAPAGPRRTTAKKKPARLAGRRRTGR